MEYTNRYRGMLRYLNAHWPAHALGLVCLAVLLILMYVAAAQGLYSLLFFALAALITISYLLTASVWSAHQLYDPDLVSSLVQSVYDIDTSETIVDIHVSTRAAAVEVSRLLITGKVIAIDVYNPQLASSSHIKRLRKSEGKLEPDPRLSSRDSDISLLPLPDRSVPVVMVVETLSEFWQEGDRDRLLNEIYRILQPGGSLILIEQMRTRINLLLKGPGGLSLRPLAYWIALLENSGFVARKEASHRDMITGLQFIRPEDPEPGQYRLLDLAS